MVITDRVRKRIERDFAQLAAPTRSAALVTGASDSERVQAAVVLAAAGRLDDLRHAIALVEVDWRDLLINVGIADEDWPTKLDSLLGPATT